MFARHAGRFAVIGVLAAALVVPRAALPATLVEVRPGDTFSAIAARYTGSVRKWKDLYDASASRLADPNRILPGMRFELVEEGAGRRYLRLVDGRPTGVAAAPAAPPPAAPEPAPSVPVASPEQAAAYASDTLVVGVLPNIGAAALMAQYESLKQYLERHNPQKVRITLPSSFKSFYEGLMNGDYDLAVAAPHFARVAQRDGRMLPLAMYEPRIGAQLITTSDSALADPRELRGKTVAFANPQSLVAMYGRRWLSDQQLEDGRDYTAKGARTDMGVGRMLLTGEADAAILSNGEFRSLPPEEAARMKVVQVFAQIPNFVLLGQPRLGSDRLARLKSQLLAFPGDADGAAFAKAAGVSSIVEADEPQLRELDAYVAQTRRAMSPAN